LNESQKKIEHKRVHRYPRRDWMYYGRRDNILP